MLHKLVDKDSGVLDRERVYFQATFQINSSSGGVDRVRRSLTMGVHDKVSGPVFRNMFDQICTELPHNAF